ncbi:NAD(P)-dependent alcohol dehydrogenase [Coraliomargarita parva]|uniref:NAD(P)-dependent alcohol dehydrogenase n=1 Tax=Coraliomargarita parva TaxID=3014050 RepID=UPI0022B36755|nr:NAD(P)-dependent alcohol dehydrogenase [Coraliomargarita parva]
MKALVLEKKNELSLRDIALEQDLGPDDVRIAPKRVGICGSDVHYYEHGAIGQFVVREPMVLGHEAAGVITEVGSNVKHLQAGDRVCMEPGIPQKWSSEVMAGNYNLDPEVQFWATPPVHGCTCESVVHPSSLTFKLPDNVSLEEGALVEPLAVGVFSAKRAQVVPGDVALVFGAGTIGIVTALSALAAGCSHVIIADIKQAKLDFIQNKLDVAITTVNSMKEDLAAVVSEKTAGKGVNLVFEASGSEKVIETMMAYLAPAGRVVLVGMPQKPAAIDIVAAQVKGVDFFTVFRYANVYDRVISYIASGQLKVAPLVTHRFDGVDSIKAYEFAASYPEDAVKIMLNLENF